MLTLFETPQKTILGILVRLQHIWLHTIRGIMETLNVGRCEGWGLPKRELRFLSKNNKKIKECF